MWSYTRFSWNFLISTSNFSNIGKWYSPIISALMNQNQNQLYSQLRFYTYDDGACMDGWVLWDNRETIVIENQKSQPWVHVLSYLPFKLSIADEQWCAKLPCLVKMFKHLNELNIKMQGKEENLLSSSDKLRGLRSKLTLLRSFFEKGRLDMFLLCNVHTNSSTLSDPITQHLKTLDEHFDHYFPLESYAQFDWLHDPWSSSALESAKDMSLPTQE